MLNKKYDLVIIGGGATGSGIALDATLRGLKVLLVEKNDFAEGTSSRSTKLVHGGVRYLEKAVKKLDYSQYSLVKEGLKERYRLLQNASHLAQPITLVTPIYSWFEIPYMYIGLALYDLISGKRRLGRSQIVSKDEIIRIFPSVKKEGLRGGVRYYDGAFNDARMALALLQSASEKGCCVKNHTEVVGFTYNDKKISAIKLEDKKNYEFYEVHADCVINATGPFSDIVRRLDDENCKKMVEVSSGIHIVIDKKFLPNSEGIMIPKTEDGRVLFMLPYLDKCLVGTTDEVASLEEHPSVSQKDIEYLLRHIEIYFDAKVTKDDILSSWSGLRPLIVSNTNASTEELVREHVILKSKSGLISIIGGKWTSYRKMAEEVVDYALKLKKWKNLHTCQTKEYKLVGSRVNLFDIKEKLDKLLIEAEVKYHLLKTYGDRALDVARYIDKYGAKKLHMDYPYVEAEIYYGVAEEFVVKPLDFLVRRLGFALIDSSAAMECLESVTLIFKDLFNWSDSEYLLEIEQAKKHLSGAI